MSKVEWRKIGDVCKVFTGGEVPDDVMKGQMIPSLDYPYPVYTNGKEVYGFSKSYRIDDDAVCISSIGANTGAVFYKKGKFTPAIRLKVLIPQKGINTRYLYYVTSVLDFRGKNTGSVPNINADYVKNKLIPIVAESIQLKIVERLDTFTSSIENLKEQIALRRKQYEYYRDQLLDLEGKEGVEMKTIGELFVFKNGLNKEKKYFGQGSPIVNYTDVYHNNRLTRDVLLGRVTLTESEIERFEVKRGDVFFTRTSETPEEIGFAAVMLDDVDNCTFSGFLLRARPLTKLLSPEYCAYCFASYKVRQAIIKYSTFTTRALTNGTSLSKILIPVPSISEQQRIANILYTFEESIQNLEAQLAGREKQYEYYRNKLLTFE